MKTIICFVLLLTISVAKDGDVYVYTSRDYYSVNRVAKRQTWSVFTFGYDSGDMLSMQIYLKNLAPNVSADVNLKYLPGATMDKKQLNIYKGEKYFEIHHILEYSKIFVEIELSTTVGFCTRQQIVSGTDVTGVPHRMSETPYNDICLREESCVIEVDMLKYICEDVKRTTLHNRFIIIIGSLSGLSVILLATIAIWKHYWIKRSPLSTPNLLPTNHNHQPFYVNMLFRRACDEEIAELDQHHYEEINP